MMNSVLHNMMAKIIGLVAAGLVIMLAGCATKSDIPVVPMDTRAPAHEYLIGPGDMVNINVWRNPEVSQSVPVRPDGKITTPLVEDLPASGRTATQLARDIEKVLGKYIQQPVVTVVVTNFVGPYSEQIRVIGQAAKPQALPYREQMSLMDVMIAVGGLAEFAAGNKASVVRTVDGKQQKIEVRLNDLIKKGDVSANMPMRPGDVLIIPESFF
jgi:polysaccharide export outer membrane protein